MGSFRAKHRTLCLLALVAGWFLSMTPQVVYSNEEIVQLKRPVQTTVAASTVKQTYIVYMASEGGESVGVASETTTTPESRYSALLKQAEQKSSQGGLGVADASSDEDTPLTYVYDSTAVQGFAAPMTTATAEALQSEGEVLAVVPDGAVDPVTTRTPEFLGLTTGKLWPKSNQGRDVIIGVIDTGVWPESASFSDAGMGPIPRKWKGVCQEGARFTKLNCNKKLIGARYFYKGHQAKEGIDFTTQILSARDTQGHGSHCASTAAGASVRGANMNGLGGGGPARGIALQARVAMYKVCWRSCYDSDILAAYDAAVKDGVDVISISLGTDPRDYIVDSLSVGAFGAMKAGIFVSHPAGNNGGMASTVTNVAPWVMTVAASTIDRNFFAGVQLGNKSKYRGKSWTTGNWGTAFFPLVRGRDARASGVNPDDADNCLPRSLNPRLVRGKIVVCQRENWDNDPIEKAQTVKDAGARGLIVIDLRDYLSPEHYVLPTVCLGSVAGGAILSYMAKTKSPTANLYPETVLGVKPAPVVATFSSRGPSYINPRLLKPDITAPGVDILAAWTENSAPSYIASDRNRIKFKLMSGTSMATPHVAGLAALLKAAYPRWSPASIKSALMTTASVTDNTRHRVTDAFLDGAAATPFDYGAGHVVPEKALNPGLVYDLGARDYINFLCAYGYSAKQVQVFNGSPTTCPKIPIRVEDFNYPSFTATFKQSQLKPLTVSFTRTVTNVGPVSASYTASFRAPAGVKITIRPTVLAFSRTVRRRTFTVTVTTTGPPRSGFGSLTWTGGGGVTVQSPLVITPSIAAN